MLLKKHFCNLNEYHLLLLKKSLDNVIHKFCKYNYIDFKNFEYFIHKNENVYISFALLLLPFYSKTVNNITSLNDLYFNPLYTNKYSEVYDNKIDIQSILKSNENSLIYTIQICSNKFFVNDIEIKPLYLQQYKNEQLYFDTLHKFSTENFYLDIGLSNDDIFNTIFNDLYYNFKNIQWMLEDFDYNSSLEYSYKYFPQYNLKNNFSNTNYDLYITETRNIFSHSWYSLNDQTKIKNIDIFHFARTFTNSQDKIIWFDLTDIQKNQYIDKFKSIQTDIKDILIDIVFESLIIKGCLSKFDFEYSYTTHDDYYFFLTGKKHPVIKNTFYTMNWLSQLNFFHHFIHHRIIFITGGTGVGKSTQSPILLMYSDIMIYYDLYSQIMCSVPRKNAVENNANRIISSLLLEKNKDYNIQFQHSEANYLYPFKFSKINIKIVTDEILKNYLIQENIFCIRNGNVTLNHILIDESHEHKINMDLIISILKHSLFKYNFHTKLFIISATMDEDDLNYRQFFENIYDKDIFFKNKHPFPQYLDRRLHISEYKKLNNFTITEFYCDTSIKDYETAEKKAIHIIKDICFNTQKGTILLFSIGIKEIESIIYQLNNIIPSNTIAVPLYSKFHISYRNAISSIDFLNQWNYDRKYVIQILNNYHDTWNSFKLPFVKNKYERYIIVGTNIVEASLTISSLKYIVDTGFEKVSIYSYQKKKEMLHVLPISESSRIQRRGRVGRVSNGFVYYTYMKNDRKNNKIQKEIQNQDISSYLFDIIGYKKDKIYNLNNSIPNFDSIYIDGFDIKQIYQNDFFIIKPSLNIQNFFNEQKKHFLWKSLFNPTYYKKLQEIKTLFIAKYLNNYETIIILQAYYLFNQNDFIRFLKKYIIEDEKYQYHKINIINSDKYIFKDTNYSVNLLLHFLQNNTTNSYYTQINKNNIHLFL